MTPWEGCLGGEADKSPPPGGCYATFLAHMTADDSEQDDDNHQNGKDHHDD